MKAADFKKVFTKNLPLLLLFFFAGFFFVKANLYLDPDLGWRIKAGQTYLTWGIPGSDPFTYTMPSFPWVDHAWAQSLFMGCVFDNFGLIILSVFYVLAVMVTLWVCQKRIKPEDIRDSLLIFRKSLGFDPGFFGSIPLLLSLYLLLLFFGIRTQVVSWLMLSVLLNFLLDAGKWAKFKKLAPLFFLFWANLHGSFFLGLSVTLAVLSIRSFRLKRIEFSDIAVFGLSVFATFLNPYRFGIWREAWSSVADAELRWLIAEWMPSLTLVSLPVAIMISLSFVLIIKNTKIFKLEEKVLYFVFLLAAVSSRRLLPIWVIVALPMTFMAVVGLYKQAKKIKKGEQRFYLAYRISWYFVLSVILIQIFLDFKKVTLISETNYYPRQAVNYLKSNLPEGEIFSDYGWGGYLIWKLPQKKVFIDGRMPSWRWQPKSSAEESSAFDTYNEILKGEKSNALIFKKYAIDAVLWPKPKEKSFFERFCERTGEYFGKKENFYFTKELENNGWIRIYEDSVAVIFTAGKP